MNPDDERCQTGALIRTESGRVYEVVSREKHAYPNYGRLGGSLGNGLFVAIPASGCSDCGKCTPHGNAERGHVGWLSMEQAARAVLEPTPDCPDVYEEAA